MPNAARLTRLMRFVDGFGRAVGDSGVVPGGNLVSPPVDGAAEPVDLWRARLVLEIRCELADEGARVGMRGWLFGPLLDTGHQRPAPVDFRRALKQIDRTLTDYIDHTRPDTAA